MRSKHWIQTASGRKFDLRHPRAEDVTIGDIARALSRLPRFNGHTTSPYTVAEHSVRVSHACDPQDACWGLLHDAAEAYVGDVTSPLKAMLPSYREIERRVMAAICDAFGLPKLRPRSVTRADRVLLATEREDLMLPTEHDWGPLPPRLSERITPWSHDSTEARFLARYAALRRHP